MSQTKYRYCIVVEAGSPEEAADKVFDRLHNRFGGPEPIEASDMEEVA